MRFNKSVYFDDMKLKICLGNVLLSILYLRFEATGPTWHSKKHCHSSFELHFVSYGKGVLYTDNHKFEIGQGAFYLTGPGVYHEQISYPEDPMMEYCINFEVSPIRKKFREPFGTLSSNEEDRISETLQKTDFWFGNDEFDSMRLFEQIYGEIQEKRLGYFLSVRNYISQIIVHSIRSIIANPTVPNGLPIKTPDENRRIQLDKIFIDRYQENLSTGTVAAELNLSSRQLNRVSNKYYNMPFLEKLIITRLENACSILAKTNTPVSEVSEMTGFSSPSYFSKAFRKEKGISPKKYRESNRQ